MSEQKEKEVVMTPEELAAQRKNVIQYYKNQVEILKHQFEYEELLANIEEARTKRMAFIVRQAQMTAGPESEDSVEQEIPVQQEEKKERKLKSN